MSQQFDRISIIKKPTIHYSGHAISYKIHLQDGIQKTLGVFMPYEHPMVFQTHVDERMEIVSGICYVQVDGIDDDYKRYASGESFYIAKNSQFKIKVHEVVDYVCHFE